MRWPFVLVLLIVLASGCIAERNVNRDLGFAVDGPAGWSKAESSIGGVYELRYTSNEGDSIVVNTLDMGLDEAGDTVLDSARSRYRSLTIIYDRMDTMKGMDTRDILYEGLVGDKIVKRRVVLIEHSPVFKVEISSTPERWASVSGKADDFLKTMVFS